MYIIRYLATFMAHRLHSTTILSRQNHLYLLYWSSFPKL
jgi:hypothetical protein